MNLVTIKDKALQLAVRWFFIVLPTAIVGYVTLVYVNRTYTAFSATLLYQAIFFSLGLVLSYSLYFFRARWLVTFLLLWLAYWIAGKVVTNLPGEFDVFYATAKYQLYSAVFIIGWIFGLLLMRVRHAYIILCAVLTVATLVAVSNTIDVSLHYILVHLVPVVVFGLYMLFLSLSLTESREMDLSKSGRLLLRFGLFLAIVLFAFVFVEKIFHEDLKAVEKELADRGGKGKGAEGGPEKKEGGYDERYGLMDKPGKGDDGYRLKDTMKINSKMSQSDQLMFCARIDNYFEDGTPKPLYIVYHYLTRYDPAKGTFTRDVNVPSLDEFDIDPAALPMFHAATDTTILRKAKGQAKRLIVESDIYLSENTWRHALLAPASAFYIQTIPIEKDFQKTYYAAYKVRSYTSELNWAYFVYNPTASPMLEDIQQERFEVLGGVSNYHRTDTTFLNYYTQMPSGGLYDSIATLAHSLAPPDASPLEKVLAVRDHFMARDEHGRRIFRYTLKPGGVSDQNIPSASMLSNFLFKTHAGYCTYYAGASIFMLRALGIPTRFTTGFATINRSDKNKGWYWFYASQAHAWTQVYFPNYGWMDFDMTIGNEDQQNAPRPDGTPPLPPPEPWLVLNAKAETAPTGSKHMDISFAQFIYFNNAYELKEAKVREIDAFHARVLYDKKDTTLSCVIPGDSIVVVSYKDEARRIPKPRPEVPIEMQVAGFPSPIIADEIHIKPRPVIAKKEDPKKKLTKQDENPITWQQIVKGAGIFLASAILILFFLPLFYLLFLVLRSKLATEPQAKAYRTYQAALYQFHMAGVERENQTPLDYARTKADPVFNAGFEEFMSVYLRLKYSGQSLMEGDSQIIDRFSKSLGNSVRNAKGFFRYLLNYFNILLASRYFEKPETSETENQP